MTILKVDYILLIFLAVFPLVAINNATARPTKTENVVPLIIDTTSPTTTETPVGLALEVEDGVGIPIKVRAGQTFFINQIDLRTMTVANVDEDLDGLEREGDFADLDWYGLELVDQEFLGLPNADGTFTRLRFFRKAKWMDGQSHFAVTQVDANGKATAPSVSLRIGEESRRRGSDDMFTRRLRGIQWTYDCASKHDCSTATNFLEEALVEVRYSMRPQQTTQIQPTTVALHLTWSLQRHSYIIPLEQIHESTYDYGYRIELEPLTPPQSDGTYAPGSNITFRLTQRDGSGTRLHPDGSLPTYNEVLFGENEAGLQYYRAFFDPSATYYRRKHQERMLMVQMVGPAQTIQPIRSVAELEDFLGPNDTQVVALPERDGVYGEFQTFPPANDLFGGAFDPTHAGWAEPVSDRFTFSIPSNAEAGTYLVTAKGRRSYLGEDIPHSVTIEVQVGTPEKTEPHLLTGGCKNCHKRGADLALVLHANDNRAACDACHVPLAFELEGPIYVRLHFIHSRLGDRFGRDHKRCASCHLDESQTQRTSKSACLGCHNEYPMWHVALFGEVEGMYIGGDRTAFQQCTESCHRSHIGSGFGSYKQ